MGCEDDNIHAPPKVYLNIVCSAGRYVLNAIGLTIRARSPNNRSSGFRSIIRCIRSARFCDRRSKTSRVSVSGTVANDNEEWSHDSTSWANHQDLPLLSKDKTCLASVTPDFIECVEKSTQVCPDDLGTNCMGLKQSVSYTMTSQSLATEPPPTTQLAPITQPSLRNGRREDNRVIMVRTSDEKLHDTLAADGYELGMTMAAGAFGKVRKATKTLPSKKVVQLACKVMSKEKSERFIPRELEILCAIRHPHLVRTHRVYATSSTTFVFMDLYMFGDLAEYINVKQIIPLSQGHLFFKQICDAVSYLHQHDICHRDIKCENVLLESLKVIRLSDFGFSRVCSDEQGRQLMSKTFCGTLNYEAPEVIQAIPYDPKAIDVWSLGVLLYKLLGGTFPFPHSTPHQILSNQLAKKVKRPIRPIPVDAMQIIKQMLEPDVTRRATIEDIRKNKWTTLSIEDT